MASMEAAERNQSLVPDGGAMRPDMIPAVEKTAAQLNAAEEARCAAAAQLPLYEVAVVKRETLKAIENTRTATFIEEKVQFSDGAVRTMTLGIPKLTRLGDRAPSPYPISGSDAWLTGPDGINRKTITYLVNSGYPVVWLHHQGRHTNWPTTIPRAAQLGRFLFQKSIGRSAHHQHALFDDLGLSAPFNTGKIFSTGDSRGAMTGEAVDALASRYNRQVAYSDYIAACFEHRPSKAELPALSKAPLEEMRVLGKTALSMARQCIQNRDLHAALQNAGTFDLHPLNILQEIAWLVPLMNGDAGRYAKAVPLGAIGVRTLLVHDRLSQQESWIATHKHRPNIRIMINDGCHLDHLHQRIQQTRLDRFQRLLQELRDKDFRLPAIDFSYVIGDFTAQKTQP